MMRRDLPFLTCVAALVFVVGCAAWLLSPLWAQEPPKPPTVCLFIRFGVGCVEAEAPAVKAEILKFFKEQGYTPQIKWDTSAEKRAAKAREQKKPVERYGVGGALYMNVPSEDPAKLGSFILAFNTCLLGIGQRVGQGELGSLEIHVDNRSPEKRTLN